MKDSSVPRHPEEQKPKDGCEQPLWLWKLTIQVDPPPLRNQLQGSNRDQLIERQLSK